MTAALRLRQSGRSVVVLEARDRVGGRVWTGKLEDGTAVDFGGAWLGPGQDRFYALAREMKVSTYRTYSAGENLMLIDGKLSRYKGVPLSLNPLSILNVGLSLKRIDSMAQAVPVEKPWTAAKAREWDSTTLGSWLGSPANVQSELARRMLEVAMAATFTTDPEEISFLHVLFHFHATGGTAKQFSVGGGAQQDRVVGGGQAIVDRIAERLGDTVKLQSPARGITQINGRLEVTSDELSVVCRRVIVALPPTMAGQIEYCPGLPPERAKLHERDPSGAAFKVSIIYPQPFWRKDGLSGQALSLNSLVPLTIDSCTERGAPGILTAFSMGARASKLAALSPDDRKATVIEVLVELFGKKAASPIGYFEHDWVAEEWTRGGNLSHFQPGIITSSGQAVRTPVGRIHWAGTETATIWNGGIEGAIRSGERVAREVIKAD